MMTNVSDLRQSIECDMPMDKLSFPRLTMNILENIIKDGILLCPHVKRIGLIGSYARNQQHDNSDVDLILDTDNDLFREALKSFGTYVSDVLDYQFNKRLEIVRYSLALKRANEEPASIENWYYQEGYQQMLKEVRWIYER